MFVIAGATGRTGKAAAEALLARGERVRVVARDASKAESLRARGAEVAVASLDDAAALARALDGARALYALLPEDPSVERFHEQRRDMAFAIAEAVRAREVPHVVFLSALAAVLPEGNGPAQDLHRAERLLRDATRTFVALRAAYFAENLAEPVRIAVREGMFPTLLPADAKVPIVATADVGRIAARLLAEPSPSSEVVDVLGPMTTMREIATLLESRIGRGVRVVEVPPDAHVAALTHAGLGQSFAEAIVELYACFRSGRVAPSGDRAILTSTPIGAVLDRWLEER